jgi:hypothetical protein
MNLRTASCCLLKFTITAHMSSNGLFCQEGLLKSLRDGSFEHRVDGLQGIALESIVDENPGLPLRYAVRRPDRQPKI